MVMRHGRIVEQGGTAELLRNPASGYARELLAAARQLERTEFGP
jgi:ABC-type microcin C transport system duplicated ATPase subunit YejF